MTPSELRRAVIERDKGCVIGLHIDLSHICRSRHGMAHLPTDLDYLTLEHVREYAGGQRRDEPGWCVALCHSANAVTHEGSALRNELRIYLAGVRAQAHMLPVSEEAA